jgi:hypothetical protein
MLGVQYIVEKAAQANRPVAICISVGTNQSGHANSNALSEYLDIITTLPKVTVCCAMGNEAQARHHTSGRLEDSGVSRNVELNVNANTKNVYIELWNSEVDRLSVGLRSPIGEVVEKNSMQVRQQITHDLPLSKSSVEIYSGFSEEKDGAQFTIICIRDITPGIWTITVYGDFILSGNFDMWLPLTGFIDKDTVFLTPVPNTTLVTPAGANGVISVGAYDSKSNSMYVESSWGPTRQSAMTPDFVAPGVEVGGVFPTGSGIGSGTSAATAIATGACAQFLQWGIVDGNYPNINSTIIRSDLINGVNRDATLDYPKIQWGYGRMNLYNSIRLAK